jgi:hypothetical protein
MNENKILLNSVPMDEIENAIEKIKATESSRINATPDNAHEGLTQLVMTLIELIRKLIEKQAIRRVEAGSLSEDEIERLGETLMKLEMKMEELKEIFNQKSFSNIRAITAKRAKHVKARIKEYDYATILQVIDISENSDFLKGKNATNWKLDFDWMLDPNNFVKILEGKYGSNNSAPTAPAKPVMTQEERSKLRRYAKFPIKEGM